MPPQGGNNFSSVAGVFSPLTNNRAIPYASLFISTSCFIVEEKLREGKQEGQSSPLVLTNYLALNWISALNSSEDSLGIEPGDSK